MVEKYEGNKEKNCFDRRTLLQIGGISLILIALGTIGFGVRELHV